MILLFVRILVLYKRTFRKEKEVVTSLVRLLTAGLPTGRLTMREIVKKFGFSPCSGSQFIPN